MSGVNEVVRLGVLVSLTGHAADDAEIISAGGDVGKQLADRDPALSVAVEVPRTGHDAPHVVEHRGLHLAGHWFARILLKPGLGIERVHLGHAAGHE